MPDFDWEYDDVEYWRTKKDVKISRTEKPSAKIKYYAELSTAKTKYYDALYEFVNEEINYKSALSSPKRQPAAKKKRPPLPEADRPPWVFVLRKNVSELVLRRLYASAAPALELPQSGGEIEFCGSCSL